MYVGNSNIQTPWEIRAWKNLLDRKNSKYYNCNMQVFYCLYCTYVFLNARKCLLTKIYPHTYLYQIIKFGKLNKFMWPLIWNDILLGFKFIYLFIH